MTRIWKQKAFPLSGRLFHVLIIFFFQISAQSFAGGDSGIHIEEGTSVYIREDVVSYGLTDNSSVPENSLPVEAHGSGLPLHFNKKKSSGKDRVLKKAAEASGAEKAGEARASRVITLPFSESRYRLGFFDNNVGFVLVTVNSSVKFTALHERLSFEKYIRFREEERVSYAVAPGPVSGILIIHFSRPPPFRSIV